MTETQHRTHVWDPHEHRMAAGTPNTLSSLTAPRGGTQTGKWFLSTLVIMQFLVKKDFFFPGSCISPLQDNGQKQPSRGP